MKHSNSLPSLQQLVSDRTGRLQLTSVCSQHADPCRSSNECSKTGVWRYPHEGFNFPYVDISRHQCLEIEETTQEGAWKVTDRVITSHVIILMCLNIGTDPPRGESAGDEDEDDELTRLECWIDPEELSITGTQATGFIANRLKEQYASNHPKARYHVCCDPTKDELKHLCYSVRKEAKSQRIVLHYNGNGVPKPTENGEIWVFDGTFSRYMSLSILEVRHWLGAPSLIVIDCPRAGIIVDFLKSYEEKHGRNRTSGFIVLCSSSANDSMLRLKGNFVNCPQQDTIENIPGDLFTCCLTTPIHTASYLCGLFGESTSKCMSHVSGDKSTFLTTIPGKLQDRKTPLGELNWVYTAVTDTIAWQLLPRATFQRYYRQDPLLAGLCRNYLLAQRLLRPLSCHPVIWPEEISSEHAFNCPIWECWDLTLDLTVLGTKSEVVSFFDSQLVAFEQWLLENHQEPTSCPPYLPVVLQALLSQTHRLRGLKLLVKYMDIAAYSVVTSLIVGVLPYTTRLLSQLPNSTAQSRKILLTVWAKILAVDRTCQSELMKDKSYRYFMDILRNTNNDDDDDEEEACDYGCPCGEPIDHLPTAWKPQHLALFCLTRMIEQYPPVQREVRGAGIIPLLCDILVEFVDSHQLRLAALMLCKLDESCKQEILLNNAIESITSLLFATPSNLNAKCRLALVAALTAIMGTDPSADKKIAACLVQMRDDMNASVRTEVILGLDMAMKGHTRQFNESNGHQDSTASISISGWRPISSTLHGSGGDGTPFRSINLTTRSYQTLEELRGDLDAAKCLERYMHPFQEVVDALTGGKSTRTRRSRLDSRLLDCAHLCKSDCMEDVMGVFNAQSSRLRRLVMQKSSALKLHPYFPLVAVEDTNNFRLVALNQLSSEHLIEHSKSHPGDVSNLHWMNEQFEYPLLLSAYSSGRVCIRGVGPFDAEPRLNDVSGFNSMHVNPLVSWDGWSRQLIVASARTGNFTVYDMEKQIPLLKMCKKGSEPIACMTDRYMSLFGICSKNGRCTLYDVRRQHPVALAQYNMGEHMVGASILPDSSSMLCVSKTGLVCSSTFAGVPRHNLSETSSQYVMDVSFQTSSKSCLILLGDHDGPNFNQFVFYDTNRCSIVKRFAKNELDMWTGVPYRVLSCDLHSMLPMLIVSMEALNPRRQLKNEKNVAILMDANKLNVQDVI